MNPEELKALQIKPEAKKRPERSIWIIFLGVSLVTVVGAYYAWPRKQEERRLLDGQKERAAATSGSNRASDSLAVTNATPKADGAVLTVSGKIVNRERIELCPRFIGVVKWIGVHKGDRVAKDQVVVRLDDAEQKARLQEAEGRLANAKV